MGPTSWQLPSNSVDGVKLVSHFSSLDGQRRSQPFDFHSLAVVGVASPAFGTDLYDTWQLPSYEAQRFILPTSQRVTETRGRPVLAESIAILVPLPSRLHFAGETCHQSTSREQILDSRSNLAAAIVQKPDWSAEISHSVMASGEAAHVTPVAEDHREHEKSKPSESVFQPVKPEEERRLAVLPASTHAQHHHHHIDIDADTPVDAVRAPGCFNRLKEEVEAVVETIAEKMHLKKPPS